MKKRKVKKGILIPAILLGVLAALIVTLIIVTNTQKKKEDIKVSGEIILTVNEANAKSIAWNSEENNYAFHRGTDGKWVYDKDAEFPVSQDEVSDVFDLFRDLKAAFVIEHVTDFAQYGLKDPVSVVSINTTERTEDLSSKETQPRGEASAEGEEHTIEIHIGAFSVMDQQRYISIGDGNVYLVKDDPYKTLNVPEKLMIENDKIPYFYNIYSANVVTKNDSWTIGYDLENYKEFSYARDDYYYLEKGGQKYMLDPNVSLKYFTGIVNTTLENYVNYKVREDELGQYGLDKPEYIMDLHTYVKNNDGTVTNIDFRLLISRDPALIARDGKEAAEGEETPEFKAYLRKDDSKIIYELNEAQFKTLTGSDYNSLRYKAMMPADIGDIEGIDFTVDGQTYSITSVLDDNTRTHYFNGNALNINNLKNALGALTAESFTDEQPDGADELTMVFHLSSEKFPTVKVQCFRKDGDHSLVVVDDKPAALVSRAHANSLREALIKISLGNDVKETTAPAGN
ncbi:MAG: DUF4340 domain-containing protein [Lachnospiraceae bacterium]|nr:DUF4340 domain-containing protein [Lachnospiraceae bacterium]